MYEHDDRIVMTLDAGGTNFLFSAIQGCREIIKPINFKAITTDIDGCLDILVKGFQQVKVLLPKEPTAISFAFPGPADYVNGIIGDLPNFPAFRGGVAIGPFLKEIFGIPVYINNDGNLFAYGEALFGALPETNRKLRAAGSSKTYRNLLGLTIGTGFGAGVVINNELLCGDNGCGGDMWLMRHCKYPDLIAEEGASIRAVKRIYHELAPEDERDVSPRNIYAIAEGNEEGNMEAARESFAEMGRVIADATIHALDIVDGIVVIGGGVSNSYKYFLPAMIEAMNAPIHMLSGESFPRLQMKAINLTSEGGMKEFLKDNSTMVKVPSSDTYVRYNNEKKIGVTVSAIGTSTAVSIGAYTYALAQVDKQY